MTATVREICRRTGSLLPFHALILAYSLCVVAMVFQLDRAGAFSHGTYLVRLGPMYFLTLPVLAVLAATGITLHRTDDWRSRREIASLALAPENVGGFIAGLLAMMSFVIFMGSFTTFKNLMPYIQGGFPYDGIQAQIDRALHFGNDPGPALVRLLPFDGLRQAVEWNYSTLWALLGFIPVFFIATHEAAERFRLRYLVTLVVVWIVVGSLLALIFLSAGPAFYGNVTGDQLRFAAIDAFLRQGDSPSTAAAFQAYLWSHHAAQSSALGSGISAFPSMHVALAMLNALFLREWSKLAGHVGFAYVALILFSSVYLGWHYAIDGYISIIVVAVLHSMMRRLLGASAPVRTPPNAASTRR